MAFQKHRKILAKVIHDSFVYTLQLGFPIRLSVCVSHCILQFLHARIFCKDCSYDCSCNIAYKLLASHPCQLNHTAENTP